MSTNRHNTQVVTERRERESARARERARMGGRVHGGQRAGGRGLRKTDQRRNLFLEEKTRKKQSVPLSEVSGRWRKEG